MQLPQLKMTSQQARIGLQQTNARLEIAQPKADVHIEQPKADIRISAGKGRLTIDQTQAWEETNLKSPLRWTKTFAAKGMQAANEGVARRARQGSALVDIHKEVNIIAAQALENGSRPMRTPGIAYIPSPFAVKINYEPAEVQIDASKHEPKINVHTNRPMIQATRGQTDIRMEQYANLEIDVAWPNR